MGTINYNRAHRLIIELENDRLPSGSYFSCPGKLAELAKYAGQFARSRSTSNSVLRRRIDKLIAG